MENIEISKKSKVWVKRMFITLLVILLLPIAISLLLHVSVIQNWAAQKVSNTLSEKTETKVTLARIDFSIFRGIDLQLFKVTHLDGQEMLSCKDLNVSLSKNIFSLLNGKLMIKSISLFKPNINIKIDEKTKRSDLAILLEKISGKKDDSSNGEKLNINIKQIDIDFLNFAIHDEVKKVETILSAENFALSMNSMDVNTNFYDVKSIYIKKPQFYSLSLNTNDSIAINNTSEIKQEKRESKVNDEYPLNLMINKFVVEDGRFALDDNLYSNAVNPYHFDSKHIDVEDLNLIVKNFSLCYDLEVIADIDHLSFKERKGWNLEDFHCHNFIFNNFELSLQNYLFKTEDSNISNSIILKYNSKDDFKSFASKVLLDVNIDKSSVISLNDLSFFINGLESTEFYKINKLKQIFLSGKLIGRLNNLKGNNFNLNIPTIAVFEGDFGIRNIDNIDNALINLRVNKLNTSMTALKSLIPKFNPPATFFNLGKLEFVGNFDGYLNDFVAYGDLKTDLGSSKMDMRLDVKNGADKAKYSGKIDLKEFDLGAWTGNKDVGKISFTSVVKDGVGLTKNAAKADLEATITSLFFKGYEYKNLVLNGQLDKSNFIGSFLSTDPNVAIDFKGNVNLTDKDFLYDFKANISKIDLVALNLSKENLVFKGAFDFNGSGNNLNDLVGRFSAKDLSITRGDSTVVFDSIRILSEMIGGNEKHIRALINENQINVDGKLDFNLIGKDIKNVVKLNFPYHTRAWKFTPENPSDGQDFKFDISLGDCSDILTLLKMNDVELNYLKAKGTFNSKKKEMNFVSSIPYLAIKDNQLHGLNLLINNKDRNGDFHVHVDSFNIGSKKYNEVNISNVLDGDQVGFVIDADQVMDSIQQFHLEGKLMPHEKGYSIKIGNNNIRLYNQRWKISNDAIISLGSAFVDVQNMTITDGLRTLEVIDINNNKGVSLLSNKFDIKTLNPLINYDKMEFSGEANTSVKVNDIFSKSPDLNGSILIPNFSINNDNFGDLSIDISKPEGKPLDAILTLDKPEEGVALKVQANYEVEKKFLKANLRGKKVPIKFLGYILRDGISEVKGTVDINADALGTLSDLTLDGTAVLHDGRVKVNYLGEMYFFDNQKLILSQDQIDFSGTQIKDSQGNIGYVSGGLRHKLFKDFSLDANISGDNVIAINTTKFDNPVYYGLGKGRISVDFSGPVHSPLMVINATTGPGTRLSIPIQESTVSTNKSFIKFVDKNTYFMDTTSTVNKSVKVEGVSIVMNLSITEDAEVNLIFNENSGDIITGTGNGDLKINMSNKGDFEIFGEYKIEQGKYLFTAFNGLINKPFIVRRGGAVRWTGDPINATLDIAADYSVRTSPKLFLAEYLPDQLSTTASNATRVNLKLLLGNTLFNPSVKFNIEFPELIGELKNYADSKLRVMANNEADLNSQVFGLLVFNSFLPSSTIGNVLANGTYLQDAGINTLSEWLSSQLSLFVTSYLNQALEENGLISGIDFEFDLRNNTSLGGVNNTSNSLLPSEIEVNLKNRFRFLDERLAINVGGNYVRESFTGTQDYIIPEFFIEYALTKDRKVNLKLYAKYADLDEINLTSRRNKFGIGIRYRTEFGAMLETKNDLKDFIKEAIKERDKINK